MRICGPAWALVLVLAVAACGGSSHSAARTGPSASATTTLTGPISAASLLLPAAIKSAGVVRIATGPAAGDAVLARRLAKSLSVRPALQSHAAAAAALGDVAHQRADVAVARGATGASVTFVDRSRGVAVARGATALAAAVRAALAAP